MVFTALVLAALASLAAAGPARAASCADQVIDDWYDNARVDRIYALACYDAAIKKLPPDVLDYSSARDDIRRALQYASRGQSDPGEGAPPPPAPSQPSPASPPPPAAQPPSPPTSTAEKPPTSKPTPPPATRDPGDSVTEAGEPVDTSGPSSVPMPLIILGGLALLLLAAGSAGYITRRLQSRRAGGDDGPPPAV
jgi:hypothetical protein